ncbi:hypothetical protein GCM10025865_07360 [Paraoerskovia sediminicola]|uniref:Gamma-glutamylcyclotransferase n=1 Tax=Paraoerskovia sediminicola TaxID=1138587 RepID=A0ABN6X9C3_9CELL|nr:hypothetical protein [Paraoerskovia sediminicola]BDZ41437.1 hypothetical protein GCM10025865_07360 [Paraoerskovia sediminicola]
MTPSLTSFESRPYPGRVPPYPYTVRSGHVVRLAWPPEAVQLPDSPVSLLTYGSNACPGRLAEKFGHEADGIVVLPADLHGTRRVFACSPSRGALPYTLRADPPHREAVHVVVVPGRVGHALDTTEGRATEHYDLARLDDAVVHLGAHRWQRPLTYLGKGERGPAEHHGRTLDVDGWSTEAAESLMSELRGDDTRLPPHTVVPLDVALADAVDAGDRALLAALALPSGS